MERIKADSVDVLLSNAKELMMEANKYYKVNGNKISLYEAMNLVIALDADDRQRDSFFEDERAFLPKAVSSGLPGNISPDKRWNAIVDKSTGWATFTPETPIEGKTIKSIKIPGYDKWIDFIGMSDEDEKALLDYLGGATISDPSNVAMCSVIRMDDTDKKKKSPCGAKYLPL